jgi:SAM-dependent methyltransferase
MDVSADWWSDFFEGVAVEMWLHAVPTAQSEREADRLAQLLDVRAGAAVLDVPCGGGRLCAALAARGCRVTGVDGSAEFLAHARSTHASLPIEWHLRDMRDLPWPGRFDGAFCAGNSFGYLDDEGNAAFLRSVHAALKPGGRFVLETPMVIENLLRHLQPRPWWKVGDIHLLVDNQYDAVRGRLDTEYTFVSDGRTDVRRGSHRAYACRELVALVTGAGFTVEFADPWTPEAPVVWLVATKR